MNRLDGTYPLVMLNHVVNRLERELFALCHVWTHLLILFLQFVIKFRASFVQICLVNIENVIDGQSRMYVILCPFLFRQSGVVIVVDLLLRFLVNTSEGCDEDWDRLAAFVDRHLG